MAFASAGYNVMIYDIAKERVDSALKSIENQLKDLEAKGTIRGSLPASKQISLIGGTYNLAECLKDAIYCQVSGLDIKI